MMKYSIREEAALCSVEQQFDGMKRRDEAHAAMQDANDQQRQRIKSLETEIEGYKKQIAKEEEHNEKLTLVLTSVRWTSRQQEVT
ncbi:CCDC40 [Bugula neritina]|uniref:CCDC40 n=1 Tax=Bugula neritina TaxID=10212 RepID=A0A7J7KQ68_BUGNE|nr:CCDC40 [Bugula neritina]